MKAQILKIAGVKSEKEFYKKYPSEEAFMKVHGKEFKKAQGGSTLDKNNNGVPDYIESVQGVQGPDGFTPTKFNPGNFSIPGGISAPSVQDFGNKSMQPADPFNPQPFNTANNWIGKPKNKLPEGVRDSTVPSDIGYKPPKATGEPQTKKGTNFAEGIPIVGGIVGGIKAIGEEQKRKKEAKMWSKVTGLNELAANSIDVDARFSRKYVRPEDQTVQPNQMFPTYGVGTNVLTRNGGNISRAAYGAEIQNTYAPNTLYDDLGYEPLNDSNIKQYYGGGWLKKNNTEEDDEVEGEEPMSWGAASKGGKGFGQNPYGGMVSGVMGSNGGGQVGGAIGSIFGPVGGMIGQSVGTMFDDNEYETAKYEDESKRHIDNITRTLQSRNINNRFSASTRNGGNIPSYEEGGWVSHDWQPQVISHFGDHTAQDVYDYAHEGMDSLRSGGHLTGEYQPISNRGMQTYKDGGDVKYDTKNSIVDLLKSQNKNSDYSSRKKLADTLGIKDYKGSAHQNMYMMHLLEKGNDTPKQKTAPTKKDFNQLTPIKKSAITRPSPIAKPVDKPTKKQEPIIKQQNPFGNIEPIIKPVPKNNTKPVTKPTPVADTKKTITPIQQEKQTPIKKTVPTDVKHKVITNPKADISQEARKLQSGVITDKGTNTSHIIENGKIVKSFPVLTGSARNWNSNDYTMDYLETHHKKKGTPTGTYLMNPNADLYGEPGFDLQPISAFGEKAPTAKSTAMHVTYPKEFKTRDPLYTQSPEKRAVTYGCTNCRHEDISELSKAFPKQDTAIYVDSRLPKDASFLKKMNQKEYGGEIESYRNGGNFNQQYAMGGEVSNYELGGVSVDSGGYLEPISYNPYNDGTGVTSMIKGQSHDEYDSKLGHSGVMINAYGNQVEAERGEFIREVKEGGEVGGNNETAVITGNLVYKNLNNMLDSKYDKYLNKKVKNIHKEIALKDKKLNKLQEKNTEEINNYSPITAQDKLYGATLAAQQFGYDMQYKNNATAANDFTNYQSSINDTAEEHGLVADDLAKGKVKFDKEALKEYAKYGTSIPKAQTGMFTPSSDNLPGTDVNMSDLMTRGSNRSQYETHGEFTSPDRDSTTYNPHYIHPAKQEAVVDSHPNYASNYSSNYGEYKPEYMPMHNTSRRPSTISDQERFANLYGQMDINPFGDLMASNDVNPFEDFQEQYNINPFYNRNISNSDYYQPNNYSDKKSPTTNETPVDNTEKSKSPGWNIKQHNTRLEGRGGSYDATNTTTNDMNVVNQAKHKAEMYNKSVQDKYGNSSNPKAQERARLLRNDIDVTPSYKYGGSVSSDEYVPIADKGKTIPRSEIEKYKKDGYKQDPKNPNRYYKPGTSKEVITQHPGSAAVIKKGTVGKQRQHIATPAWLAASPEKRKQMSAAEDAKWAKNPASKTTQDEVITPAVAPSETKEMVTTPGDEVYTGDGEKTYKTSDYKRSGIMDAFNVALPFLRPSNQESLDPRQLTGEMYALGNNQLEPVQAQGYHPDLGTPYDISLQDQMNEITAQTRAAQKMAQGNPAAQAVIAGQAYDAINKVKGEEFRANQAMKDNVYDKNRDILNQAKMTNLNIFDKQYDRQSQAKSNTKAITQAALSSIADKYSKNKLENRELGIAENLYNYRYDPSGRAINMNPFYQPNIPDIYGKEEKPNTVPEYDASGKQTGWRPALTTEETTTDYTAIKKNGGTTRKKIAMNGSLVKMYKTI